MASIPWYLPLLVLLVNTFGASTTGPLLAKSREGIKTVEPSTDGVVKGVKGIGVKSITAAGDFLKGTVPPSPKNLPDDIDPFALPSAPTSNVNNGTPLSPGNVNEVPNVPGGVGGALNPDQSGTGRITKTTTTNNVLSITNTGSSTTQPTGGSTPTLQPLGPRTIIPGAPGDSSIMTSTGVNLNRFVGSTMPSGRQVPPISVPSTIHGAIVGMNNVPASSGINSRTSNIHSAVIMGVKNSRPGAISSSHTVPSVGVTGSGVEVEVPGLTTGLDRRWKWVLARRTGMFPPYIQAIDPEVLYFKLGYQVPSLPVLPDPVQRLLNNIPVQPAGSGIYGRRSSATLIDIIRKIARVTALKNLLLSSKLAHKTNQTKLLTSLIASETSGSSGASPIERLLLQSDSQSSSVQPGIWSSLVSLFGSDPYGFSFQSPYAGRFRSPYRSFYGGTYGSTSGSPWSTFPGAPFSGNTWPYYSSSPLAPFAPYAPGSGPYSSIGTYGVPSGSLYPGFPGYDESSLTKSILSYGVNTGSTGMRYVPAPHGTLSSLIDPFSTANNRGYNGFSMPGSSTTFTERLIGALTHPRQYTLGPKGELLYNNGAVPYETGPLSTQLGSTSNPSYNLFRNTATSKTSFDQLIRSDATYPYILLNLLRANPRSPVVNAIVKQVILQQRPGGIFSSLLNNGYRKDIETGGATKMMSLLRSAINNPNDIAGQVLARLAGISPETIRLTSQSKTTLDPTTKTLALLQGLHQPTEGSPYDTLNKLLLGTEDPLSHVNSRHTLFTPDYASTSGRYNTQPQITDTSVKTVGPEKMTVGMKEAMTKTVDPSSLYTSAFTRQPISKTQVLSNTYSSRLQPTLASSITSVTPGLHVTGQAVQPSSPLALLGLRNVPGMSSGTLPLPLYGTSALHPQFPTGTSVSNTPGVFVNGQFVSSTNGILGSTLGQTGLPVTTAAYTASIPIATGYVSGTTTSHPYILGSSQIGAHPHYIVEGHEAPGTRWQLKVWRNHPGVSAIIPGVSGYTSYVSGTPVMGLLGSSSPSGIPVVGGATSHYIVHGPAPSTGFSRIISSVGRNQASSAYIPSTSSLSGSTSSRGISSGNSFTASPGSASSTTGYYYSSRSGGNGYSGVSSGANGGMTSGLQGSSGDSLSSFDSSSGSSGLTQEHLSQTKLQ